MGTARGYRQYPENIKLEVARSANPYLFPELKIPRTTALYWISNSKKLKEYSSPSVESKRTKQLSTEVERLQILLRLVRQVRAIFPHSFTSEETITRPHRKKIVRAILNAAQTNRIPDCLSAIGLSRKLYAQWLTEFFLCESEIGKCDQRKPNQLTTYEIQTMRQLVTSNRYSHVPINSLYLLAQRKNLLFCSLDTWYKYIRIFGWVRQRRKIKKNTPRKGLRSHRPNEVWHIDATQVQLKSGQKIYVQVVYDNFSRFVITWKVTTEVNGLSTVELLRNAKKRALELGHQLGTKVIMDGGPENNNTNVLNFITSKSLERLIARVDIHFSNSMVESLFCGLKNNFLNSEDLLSKEDVEQKIEFYFRAHNDEMPRALFKGATPREKFLNLWTEGDIEKLKSGLKAAYRNRLQTFSRSSCRACDTAAETQATFSSASQISS
jgi:putative transposase